MRLYDNLKILFALICRQYENLNFNNGKNPANFFKQKILKSNCFLIDLCVKVLNSTPEEILLKTSYNES